MQQIQDRGFCRRAIAQSQLNGAKHGLFVVLENQSQDLHHFPVAGGIFEEMFIS